MPFRIRQDTEDWFKHISGQGPIETKFDLYYLCMMLGLATGRSSVPSKQCANYSDFVENFVLAYRPMQRLIIGLVLVGELSRLGLSVSEREAVRREVDRIVDPMNPTNLTEIGMAKMNEYSSGGFDYLAEQFDTKPYHVEEFLQSYVKLLRPAAEKNRVWQAFMEEASSQTN